jgi:hypothetical protein
MISAPSTYIIILTTVIILQLVTLTQITPRGDCMGAGVQHHLHIVISLPQVHYKLLKCVNYEVS